MNFKTVSISDHAKEGADTKALSCSHNADHKKPKRGSATKKNRLTTRVRPTNNQLQYKAYFRWFHCPASEINEREIKILSETDACASVTAAFLQVLNILQEAEFTKQSNARNILKILAQNTRHTKVVNISSTTHRITEELKRHCLTCIEGHKYTTNLDRNRYGNDDQYLFTVIRNNLSYLDICPCLVDIEVLDQKSNESIMVSAGTSACLCNKVPNKDSVADVKNGKKGVLNSAEALNLQIPVMQQNQQNSACLDTDSLQDAVNAFKSNTSFSEITRESIKKEIEKKNISMQQSFDGFGEGQWVPHERVEDNDAPNLTENKRVRDSGNDGTGIPWQQRNKIRIAKQSSSVGPKSAAKADIKRLHAEVNQLGSEMQNVMQEISDLKKDMGSIFDTKQLIEENRLRIRQLENEVYLLKVELCHHLSHTEEESQHAENQLLANRQVIGLLLNRLQQELATTQSSVTDSSFQIPREDTKNIEMTKELAWRRDISFSPKSLPIQQPGAVSTLLSDENIKNHILTENIKKEDKK